MPSPESRMPADGDFYETAGGRHQTHERTVHERTVIKTEPPPPE
jgi:hypothetical protein